MTGIEIDIAVVEQAIKSAVTGIKIKSDEPDYIGNRPIFIFVQYLLGIGIPRETDAENLELYYNMFHEQAEELIVGIDEEPLSYIEGWMEFIDIWDTKRVKFAKGNRLERAKMLAMNNKTPRPEIAWADNEAVEYLWKVICELAEMTPDGSFFLSGYVAGDILNRSQRIGRLNLIMFCNKCMIELVKKGTVGPNGKATVYKRVVLSPEQQQQLKLDAMKKALLESEQNG